MINRVIWRLYISTGCVFCLQRTVLLKPVPSNHTPSQHSGFGFKGIVERKWRELLQKINPRQGNLTFSQLEIFHKVYLCYKHRLSLTLNKGLWQLWKELDWERRMLTQPHGQLKSIFLAEVLLPRKSRVLNSLHKIYLPSKQCWPLKTQADLFLFSLFISLNIRERKTKKGGQRKHHKL